MLFCSAGNGERGQWFLRAQLILQSATACAARGSSLYRYDKDRSDLTLLNARGE